LESIRKSNRNHETWLSNYKGNTVKKYRMAWNYWTSYLGSKDESWIFENRDSEDWAAHLVNFHRWLKMQPKKRGRGKLSDNTARLIVSSLRAYLKHVGMPVSFSRVQQLEISKVESCPMLDYPLNLQVKEQLLRVANPEEEYIVSTGVSFGLRIGDFQQIRRGQLEPLLDQEPPVQLPKLMTKKMGVAAYPFIDRDARDAIVRLLQEMDAQGRTKSNSRMLTLTQRQINEVLRNLFKKAGVPIGEYRVRFHILRKFLTDNLAKVCASDKWKHFVGKSATSPYVGSEGRESYTKVIPFTNVNGRKIRTGGKELENIESQMITLGQLTNDMKARIEELEEKSEISKDIFRELIEKGHREDIEKASTKRGMTLRNLLSKLVKSKKRKTEREGRYVY